LWLKSFRLHKYADIVVGKSAQYLSSLSEEDLKRLGMTVGASSKFKVKWDTDPDNPWIHFPVLTATSVIAGDNGGQSRVAKFCFSCGQEGHTGSECALPRVDSRLKVHQP
jgi:hypothetical protein